MIPSFGLLAPAQIPCAIHGFSDRPNIEILWKFFEEWEMDA